MWNGITLDTIVRIVLAVLALATAVVNFILARRKRS